MDRFKESQHQNAYLRKMLNIMFPMEYIDLFHTPPKSICSLMKIKYFPFRYSESPISSASQEYRKEVSTEPVSRQVVVNLRDNFSASLIQHKSKPFGLCPIRRQIYDQCFGMSLENNGFLNGLKLTLDQYSDELIRQVTISCVEQGLLLFRIRNEIRMTLNLYRRAYESGVKFGIAKAIEAELELEQNKTQIRELEKLRDEIELNLNRNEKVDQVELTNRLDAVERVKKYYEEEMIKKDQVIEQQRNIIKALSRECSDGLKSPM